MKGVFKKQSVKIGTLILVVFLLIYLPALLFLMYNDGIETDVLKLGKIEDVVNVDGVFVRNEEVIYAPDTGNCVMDALEGERIPANYRVATVVKNMPISSYEQLKKKELEIAKVEKAKSDNLNMFSTDIKKLDGEIITELSHLSQKSDGGSLVDSYEIIKDIDKVVYRKSDIFGSSSTSEGYINKLKQEKTVLEQKLSNNIKEINTSSSGVISYSIDGYEGRLTPDFISNATPKDIDEIDVKETNRDFNVIEARKNQPVAKLVKDLESYLLCAIDEELTKELTVDKRVTLRINEIGKSIDAHIVYSSNAMDGKRVVAFRFDTGLNETVGLRRVNVDLVKSSANGMKVPKGCLQNVDLKNKTAEIYLVKGSSIVLRKVNVIGMNADAAIIDTITGESTVSLYNTYILNPKNIEEGQTIN